MGPRGVSRARKYWTILQVGVVVWRIRIALRFQTLPKVLEHIEPLSTTAAPDDAEMKILTHYVDRWLRLFPYNKRGNCFPRALALYRFARQRGYPVRFHCGVRREAAGLDGHAWLTLDAETFHEPGSHWRAYTVTFSYPPESASPAKQGVSLRPHNFRTMRP